MTKSTTFGISLIATLLILSLDSWGSTELPQLTTARITQPSLSYAVDSIPAGTQNQQPEPASAQQPTAPVEVPVVKEVPKSRRKVKPSSLPRPVNIPPTKVIKPKVIIRKINVKV